MNMLPYMAIENYFSDEIILIIMVALYNHKGLKSGQGRQKSRSE